MSNDRLVELIQSFSSREKTTFKRYAAFNSENRILNYVVLFDVYNKLLKKKMKKEEWEKHLEKALKKLPHIQKDLANIKKRLKDKLLESLVTTQTGKKLDFQSKLSVNILSVLFERKLYAEMKSRIKQLRKQALAIEQYQLLTEIIDWEIRLLMAESHKNDWSNLQELTKEQQHFFDLYALEMKLRNIYREMSLILELDLGLKKESSQQAFEALGQTEVLVQLPIEKFEQDKNVKIVLWYYRARNVYYRSMGESQLAFQESKKLIVFFELDESLKKKFHTEYIKALCGFTRACFQAKQKKQLGNAIEKVKSIYDAKNDFSTLEATCDMGVLHYLNTLQYEKAKSLVELMSNKWDLLEMKIKDGKLLFYTYTNFLLYWLLSDKENLETWLDKTLNIARSKKGRGYFFTARLLKLTYDYDQKEFFYFNEKIEALKKTLDNNENLMEFERISLRYFKSLLLIESGDKYINLTRNEKNDLLLNKFEEFKFKLSNLNNGNKHFVAPMGYEEILIWCESKIQNKSLQLVFEESIQKQA